MKENTFLVLRTPGRDYCESFIGEERGATDSKRLCPVVAVDARILPYALLESKENTGLCAHLLMIVMFALDRRSALTPVFQTVSSHHQEGRCKDKAVQLMASFSSC